MTSALLAFLARLYVDDALLERFLEDPRGEALGAGLSDEDAAALERIDRPGLALATASFARKRERKRAHRRRWLGH